MSAKLNVTRPTAEVMPRRVVFSPVNDDLSMLCLAISTKRISNGSLCQAKAKADADRKRWLDEVAAYNKSMASIGIVATAIPAKAA